jgi:hypothetical protein
MNMVLILSGLALLGAIGVAILWVTTAICGAQLLKSFKETMPGAAFAAAPALFVSGRNPQKVLFFFSKDAERLLAGNVSLLNSRNRFVKLALISAFLPFCLVGCLAVLIILFG